MPDFHMLEAKGLSAICHAMIKTNHAGLVYLNFSGPVTAVRAITACLRDSDQRAGHKSKTELDGETVFLAEQTHYIHEEAPLDEDTYNCVLMHPAVSPSATAPAAYLRAVGDERPDDFEDRIRESMLIPFMDEWADPVWAAVQNPKAHGLDLYAMPIVKLESFGRYTGYQITRSAETWLHALPKMLGRKLTHGA